MIPVLEFLDDGADGFPKLFCRASTTVTEHNLIAPVFHGMRPNQDRAVLPPRPNGCHQFGEGCIIIFHAIRNERTVNETRIKFDHCLAFKQSFGLCRLGCKLTNG